MTVKAGQEIRLLEIPVFGAYGSFDDLHGMKDGRLFSDTLQKNTTLYYGVAGIAYLEKLVNDTQDLGELLEQSLTNFVSEGMQPQEHRAARAFSLIAMAGELATNYGITGWSTGDALAAVIKCFEQWRVLRGAGTTEDKDILKLIRDFVDRYEDARFTSINDKDAQVHGVRAGWYEGLDPRVYYFTAAGLSDATTGYDNKRVVEALIKYGWLAKTKDGKSQCQKKIFGKNTKLYEITVKDLIEKGNPGNLTINSEVTATDPDIQGGNLGNLGNPEINSHQVKIKPNTVRI